MSKATPRLAAATAPAVAALAAYPFNIKLPSGKTATFTRSLKGKDAVNAERNAEKGSDIMRSYAMIAPVVLIDGKQQVMEDFMDMDLDDLGEVLENASGKVKASTPKP